MPIKPQGRYRRSKRAKPGLVKFVEMGLSEINLAVWTPRPKGEPPYEQVHFIIKLKGMEDTPMLLRFKSPDTLGFIIEELIRYRSEVWPDAKPVSINKGH